MPTLRDLRLWKVYLFILWKSVQKCLNVKLTSASMVIFLKRSESFMKSLTIDKNQCDVISCKVLVSSVTRTYNSLKFLLCMSYEGKYGKTIIVKLLMNYCPMQQEKKRKRKKEKEIGAAEQYLKRISKKHNDVSPLELLSIRNGVF